MVEIGSKIINPKKHISNENLKNKLWHQISWDLSFQYGPVIKLPLQISQGQMVNHMAAFSQVFW